MSKDQKEIKVKKVDKKGKPLQGVEFKLYLDSTIDSDDTEYSTSLTDEEGIATFKVEDFYYGGYIKETKTLDKYILRNDGKDTIHFYKDNGVRFIGEKNVDGFKVTEAKEDQNLNTHLQSLLGQFSIFRINDDVNWLVFSDNGIEKLIPKKPLCFGVPWGFIKIKGLIDGSKTITIDGKTYKIRLMKAYNDKFDVNKGNFNNNSKDGSPEKGSEWNRMILPLIGVDGEEKYNNSSYGRFEEETKVFVEKNMPKIANYSWGDDFGGENKKASPFERYAGNGVSRMMWNVSRFNNSNYAYRGHGLSYGAAAASSDEAPENGIGPIGWFPVLEEVK